MKNFHIIKEGTKIRSITNLTKDVFFISFKNDDKVIYTTFLQQSGTVSIPDEVYDHWDPKMTYINCSNPEDKKMSTDVGDYMERIKPKTVRYEPSKSTTLAIGQFDDKDGIFIEKLET
jgi:hypothetical protein